MARHSFTGMTVTVPTIDLTVIIAKNRATHSATYDAAVVEFREQAIKKLNEQIAELQAGGLPNLYFNLPVPEEHTDDYDRALRMLNMHTESKIELNEQTYTNFVEDNWDWSPHFKANTVGYLSSTRSR